MTPSSTTTDVVAAILGDDAYDRIRHLREAKPQQIADLQLYYDALFAPEPASLDALDLKTRALVAIRVAAQTRSQAVVAWYSDLARAAGARDTELAAITDLDRVPAEPAPLAAAIRRADQIATAPASAERDDIDALKAAGLSPAAILSLSQVIAFVAYQVRFLAILRALGGAAS
jgi:uncharacterized protein YciW